MLDELATVREFEKRYQKAKNQGREEGKKENAMTIARQLLSRGMTSEEIAQITALTKEEIDKLS